MKQGNYKTLPKAVFKVTDDAVKFLDNFTTNEMAKSTNAFLDKFGKLIALADQKIVNNEVYLVIEEKYKDKFLEHINNFIRFSKSKIEQLDLKVFHIINNNDKSKIGNLTISKNIGYITLLKNNELNLLDNLDEIPDNIYEIIRIENNIPVQGIDFDNNMFLETGVDAVSYTKGCYLGQEIIARTHNLGKPAKKLVRILFDKIPDKLTINGEEVGQITSKCFSPKHNKFLAFAMIRHYDLKLDSGEVLKD